MKVITIISQGSTYNNVAIIYNNIKTCWDANDRKRLAYVGVSRCKYLNLVLNVKTNG